MRSSAERLSDEKFYKLKHNFILLNAIIINFVMAWA